MARPLRLEFPGALYHVTSRGNEKRPIVRTNDDRKAFVRFLGEAVKRFHWSLTVWVLMTNHFHLVIQTQEANLSKGMHWLNSRYAAWFNKKHQRAGHLYQGRYHSYLIEKEAYLAEVMRYVVLNPVRARMVARPEDYAWSSYRATAGLEAAPEWFDLQMALAMFHPEREAAQANYCAFVEAKIADNERLWDKAVNGIYLGSEVWAKTMRAEVEKKPRSTDHPHRQLKVGRPKMHQIVAAVAKVSGSTAAAIRAQHGGPLRQLVSWIGWYEGLVTLRSIAASLRLRSEGHITSLIRRCEEEFNRSATMLGWLDASLVMLRT